MARSPIKGKFNNQPLQLGTVLNSKYIVYKSISSGGYGIVYIAKWQDQFYAVKEFIPTSFDLRTKPKENDDGLKDPKLYFKSKEVQAKFLSDLATFFLEAQVASQFNHPNIVKVVDIFEENNTAYMVMPLEKGLNFFSYIKNLFLQGKRMSEKEIIHICTQICEGLSFLHRQNFVHLDIKAGNILIRPNGQVVILDLGSCRNLNEIDELPRPAVTRGYSAPEIHAPTKDGKSEIDQRVDIYSFGALLKVILEGWVKNSPLIPAKERREIDATYYSERIGQSHADLLSIIDKCMQLDKEKRYKTIDEVKRALLSIRCARNSEEVFDYFENILTY